MAATSGGSSEAVALVTGAGQRVGRALAEALAARGYVLAAHYHRSREGAAQVVEHATRHGGGALFQADLVQPDAPAQLVRDVMARFGRLDVVVNSAAVMVRMPFGSITPSAWDGVLNLNLRAPFLIAQEAARYLPDGGTIVNIADLAAWETWPEYVPHGVSKTALVYLTRTLARMLAPRIRVNAIAPGPVLRPEWLDDERAARYAATTPLQRWGSPADVVQALFYLLEASFVTGETMMVDGGRHVRL